MVKFEQTVNSEGKNNLEPFSKELRVVLLYSIKTVVSHLKTVLKRHDLHKACMCKQKHFEYKYVYACCMYRFKLCICL